MALFRGHTSPFMTLGHTFINFEGGKMQPCSLSTFPIGDGQSLFVRMFHILSKYMDLSPIFLLNQIQLMRLLVGSLFGQDRKTAIVCQLMIQLIIALKLDLDE